MSFEMGLELELDWGYMEVGCWYWVWRDNCCMIYD